MTTHDPAVRSTALQDRPQAAAAAHTDKATIPPPRRPNLTGDLDQVLANGPIFRSHLRGYDRLQVDNYVRWAESELVSARREIEDLAARYGSALAELKLSSQLLALSPEGRELHRTSERIGEMLRLAADEAAEMRSAAAERADSILGDARAEADERLRRSHQTETAAVAAADKLRADAARARSEAETALREARAESSRLLAEATAEGDRLTQEAAAERAAAEAATAERLAAEEERARREKDAMLTAAASRVAAMEEDLADLGRQREQALQCLEHLSSQIGEVLDGLVRSLPPAVRVFAEADEQERRPAISGNGGARS